VNKSRGIASRRLFNKQKKTSNLPTKKQPAPRQFFSPTVEGGIFQKKKMFSLSTEKSIPNIIDTKYRERIICNSHRKGGGRMTSSEGSSWVIQRPGEVAET
jgi:hypothetical protein